MNIRKNIGAYYGRSLDYLGVDILLLILDELARTGNDYIWVRDHWTYRLVSQRWNKACLPLIYNTTTLTPPKVNRVPLDRHSNRSRRRVWANISIYARHVIIDVRLNWFNWNDVVKLIIRCQALESIKYLHHKSTPHDLIRDARYIFKGRSKHGCTTQFPLALSSVFNTHVPWKDVRLEIIQAYFQVLQYRSIPSPNTVSLGLICSNNSWPETEIHSFIAACKKLESLEISADSNEGGFTLSPTLGLRFPPIQTQHLSRYHFGHSPETAMKIWDFSRLKSLTLSGDHGGLRPFLLAVPGTSLPRLKRFTLSRLARIEEEDVVNWTSPAGLNYYLREFIAKLPPMKELSLDVQDGGCLLPAIIKHGKTLQNWTSNTHQSPPRP